LVIKLKGEDYKIEKLIINGWFTPKQNKPRAIKADLSVKP